MSANISDLLKMSRSITTSMQERDSAIDSSFNAARSLLSQRQSTFPASGQGILSEKALDEVLSNAFPELIVNHPEYRQLWEDNQALYQVVGEQQLSLEMIMTKYRQSVSRTPDSRNGYMMTQTCFEKHDGMMGVLLHEKGVALRVMEDSVWEDDDSDVAAIQNAARLMKENSVLREALLASYNSDQRRSVAQLAREKMEEDEIVRKERAAAQLARQKAEENEVFRRKEKAERNARELQNVVHDLRSSVNGAAPSSDEQYLEKDLVRSKLEDMVNEVVQKADGPNTEPSYVNFSEEGASKAIILEGHAVA